jgi:tetratricopeptide (TPR) repeat protein
MNETEEQIREDLWTANQPPYGPAQVAAMEDLLRQADATGSPLLSYEARIYATSAFVRGDEHAKSFVSFSWCLAAYDRGEADHRFDRSLFWFFKDMVATLTEYPEIPLTRTFAVLDDMERRYRLAGHSMNPVHQHRELVLRHVGDQPAAAEQYRLWNAAPRSEELSDCAGCEPTSKVSHLVWIGEYEKAALLAEPVLAGVPGCREQPQSMLSSVLIPFLRTGRLEEAANAHRQAYRAIQGERDHLATVGTHLEFCALTGNHARGLELVERHLGWADEPSTPMDEMTFSAAAALTLTRVAETAGPDTVVRRPAFRDRPAAELEAANLRDLLAERALELAGRFDARNGTSEQGDRIREVLTAEPIVEHLPLSGPVRRAATPVVPAPSLPDSPEELATTAERARRRSEDDTAAAAWREFDAVCPNPDGVLLARRLDGRGLERADTDPISAGEDWQRAAELFAEAGDEARRWTAASQAALVRCMTDTPEEGFADLTAAVERLAVVGDAEQHVRGVSRIATASAMLGRPDDAEAAFTRARELAEQTGDPQLLAEALRRTAGFIVSQGEDRLAAALELAERSVELFREADVPAAMAETQLLVARMRVGSDDLEGAYALMGEAAKAHGPTLRGRALHTRGRLATDLHKHDEAWTLLGQAVAELSVAGLTTEAAYAKAALASACLALDRPEDLADAAEEAIDELDRVGDKQEAAQTRFLLSKAYTRLGETDQALELLKSLAEYCAEDGNPAGVGQMRAAAAEILADDRDDLAAESYTAAAEAYAEAKFDLDELTCRRLAALSWNWIGDYDLSLAELAKAEERATTLHAEEPKARWELAMLDYDGARILRYVGRPDEALTRAENAAAGFSALDETLQASIAGALRGQLLVELGRPAEAKPILTAALRDLPEEATAQRDQLETLLATL